MWITNKTLQALLVDCIIPPKHVHIIIVRIKKKGFIQLTFVKHSLLLNYNCPNEGF